MNRNWRDNVQVDEEMDLADQAIRQALPHLFHPEIMEYLRALHAREIRLAMRRQDRARLSEVAAWKEQAEECVALMLEMRADVFGRRWMPLE